MNMVNKAARVAGAVGDITRVCAHSFFCGAASRRQRERRGWTTAAAALCLALVMSVALVSANFSLAVYYNGEEVGAARSIAEVPRIVAGVESRLTKLFGYDYSLVGAVSLAASVGDGGETAGDIEKAIILSVDGVAEMYTVSIDGEVVAAYTDADALYGILKSILDSYMTERTISARFLEDVTVSREIVTDETPRDFAEIRRLLSPKNGLLTVESIESVQYEEEAPYETEIIEDGTMYEEDSAVITYGAPGRALVTEEAVLVNGKEVLRRRAARVIVEEPVTEVIARGTMQRPKTASYGEYIWPAEGVVTSFFGYRNTTIGSRDHKGLDIAGFKGQEIYAADGGEVTFSGQSGGYGYVVIVLHDNGEETVYAHCSKLLVSGGERVYQGQVIAEMGRTGVASGVHCHFEIRVDGKQIDPISRLESNER